jgi:hypothetical protein
MRNRAIQAMALLVMGPGAVQAQQVNLGISGGQVSDETGAVHAGATISPGLTWSRPGWTGRLGLSGTVLRTGGMIGGAAAEGEASLLRSGPVALVLGGFGSAAASDLGYRATALAVAPGLRLTGGFLSADVRAVLRTGGEGRPDRTASSGFLPLPDRSTSSGMVWRDARGVAATLAGTPGPVEISLGWTRMQSDPSVSWTDLTATAGLDLGGIQARAITGRRSGVARESWASLHARIPLTRSFGAAVGVGSQPSDPLTGRAAARFATVGVELSLARRGASAISPRRPPGLRPGTNRVVLKARPGARVELLADWTNWRPNPVLEASPGVYPVDVELAPGIHRFAFRVDGRWTVPPGYPTEPDEFGGRRALLRVAEK